VNVDKWLMSLIHGSSSSLSFLQLIPSGPPVPKDQYLLPPQTKAEKGESKDWGSFVGEQLEKRPFDYYFKAECGE